ncbi:MAG TPA: hypothetical protein PLL30_16805 [Candidatus Krumholzibacteria bacterium]|nr:hypothetical protein [Candidatus Krumholzibacteria bacterium]HRY42155.1 hypothetical protein [Candidatus Krumholzibacteria bacterium]
MTQEGWWASVALAFIGGFFLITAEEKGSKLGLVIGGIFIAPLLVRLWIAAVAG